VMNQGRIEQVDDPVSLYTRPKTRFVAGFIGRTNFLGGLSDGETIGFDGFVVPAQGMARGAVSFSCRPQSIAIHAAPGDSPGWWVQGEVVERAYLGEYWDYGVRPAGSAQALRVTAPPSTVLAVGQGVWLCIDHLQAAVVPAPG